MFFPRSSTSTTLRKGRHLVNMPHIKEILGRLEFLNLSHESVRAILEC